MALPRYEGYGLTPLEGMACGLPIVASKTGYFEEFLNVSNEEKACGKIVPIDDYQSASKEILNLLTDINLFKKFSKNALIQSTKNYSVLQEAEAIKKVYEKLWSMQLY